MSQPLESAALPDPVEHLRLVRGSEQAQPSVSVVVCAYTLERWALIERAVASTLDQSIRAHEVIVVADHNEELLQRVRDRFPEVRAIANDGTRGLSGARNAGVAAATGVLVAFLDDDAAAEPTWLERSVDAFEDALVAGVGCAIEAAWEGGSAPRWFPDEFGWVVGCDYRGLPDGGAIRNPIGAAMLVRRTAIEAAGGFPTALGRVGAGADGCEETELAIRVRKADATARFERVPAAVVRHHVGRSRQSFRYFVRRSYAEGRSKRVLARRVGGQDALLSERSHATRLVTEAVPRELARGLRGDVGGPLRALALVAGLGAATIGYVVQRPSGGHG